MNSAGVTVSDSPTPGNLFDEFEEAFQVRIRIIAVCLEKLVKDLTKIYNFIALKISILLCRNLFPFGCIIFLRINK